MIQTVELADRRNLKATPYPKGIPVRRGAGMYYATPGLTSTATPSAGQLALAPIDINRVCVLTALVADVATVGSAGAVLRLAIYADDGTGIFPGALVADAGTIDATIAGAATLTLATPIPLPPGRYWIGGASQGAPTTAPVVRCVSTTGALIMPTTSASVTTLNVGAAQNSVTAAAPATFTTSLGFTSAVPRVLAQLT